jgi:hypothetical protein
LCGFIGAVAPTKASTKQKSSWSFDPRNSKEMVFVFLILIAIGAVANLSTLLRPFKVGGPGFGFGVKIWGPFSRFQNCDSPLFMEYLRNPSMLVSPGSFWQERPLYIILGKVISVITFQDNEMPFILLNIFLLIVSGILLLKTLEIVTSNHAFLSKKEFLQVTAIDKLIYACFPFMIVMLNLPTRGYLWTAHFQMFNILIPVLCLYTCAYVLRHKKMNASTLVLTVVTGALLLTYPGSNIYLFTAFVCFLHLKKFGSAILFGIGSYLPTFFWYQYIVERNGFFFSQSTSQWKQFVWISDALRTGNLATAVPQKLESFYQSFNDSYIKTSLSLLVISFSLMLIMHFKNIKIYSHSTDFGVGRYLAALYPLALYAVGTYVARLNWPVVIVIVILVWSFMVKLDLEDMKNNKRLNKSRSALKNFSTKIVFLFPGIIWVAYFVISEGPWS